MTAATCRACAKTATVPKVTATSESLPSGARLIRKTNRTMTVLIIILSAAILALVGVILILNNKLEQALHLNDSAIELIEELTKSKDSLQRELRQLKGTAKNAALNALNAKYKRLLSDLVDVLVGHKGTMENPETDREKYWFLKGKHWIVVDILGDISQVIRQGGGGSKS